MKNISININSAKIENLYISFSDEDTPYISARIGLFAENGKRVSSFEVARNNGDVDSPFPHKIFKTVMKISEIIEEVATKECNKELNLLPEPKEDVIDIEQ